MNFVFSLIICLSSWAYTEPPRLSDEAVIFRTDYGDMAVAFYPDQAPLHTKQILRLVNGGIYSKALLFRTDKGYVTQVENYNMRATPLSEEQLKLIEKIPGEFNKIPHKRGTLSMARFDDPNSAESSFSFVLGDAPNLDEKYTAFGEVIQNIEVLDIIESLPPKTVYINSAEVVFRKDLSEYTLKPAGQPGTQDSSAVQILMFTFVGLAILGLFVKFSSN